MPGLPRAADELFALPLSEFTRRRNELAKQLKSAGDKDGSARVAALPKPSLAAWALNQVARWNPKLVAELLQVDEILRSPESSSKFRKASSDRNRIVREIVEAASGMLEKNGHSAGAGVAAKLTQTLLSVGTDDQARRALIEGRLLKEVESGSFGDEAWALNVPSVDDAAAGDARDREQGAGAPGEAQEKAEATTGTDSTSRKQSEAEAERRNELHAEIERLKGVADEKARAVREAAERAKKARAEAEAAETARVAAEREAAEAAEAVGRKKAELAELAP